MFLDKYYAGCESAFEYDLYLEEDGNLKDSVIQRLGMRLERDKSPGYPLAYLGSQNGKILDSYFPEFAEELRSRVKKLEDFGRELWELRSRDPSLFNKYTGVEYDEWFHVNKAVEFVEAGLVDVDMLVVKGEPRKVGKKPRLINCVSIITNSAFRLFVGDAMQDEMDNDSLATATRLDVQTLDSQMKMYERFRTSTPSGKLMTSDIQGYEYSVKPDVVWIPFIKWVLSIGVGCFSDERLLDGNSWLVKPVEGREKAFFGLLALYVVSIHRVVATREGDLFVPMAGTVNSGRLTTFTDNSVMRAWLSFVVSIENKLRPSFIQTAGDDCLDRNNKVDFYATIGYHITDFEIQDPSSYSFCSTTFTANGGFQENIEKFFANVVFNLSEGRDKFEERRIAFEQSFSRHPEYFRYCELLDKVRPARD